MVSQGEVTPTQATLYSAALDAGLQGPQSYLLLFFMVGIIVWERKQGFGSGSQALRAPRQGASSQLTERKPKLKLSSSLEQQCFLESLAATRGLRPPEQLERPAGFPSSDKTRPDSPVPDRKSVV